MKSGTNLFDCYLITFERKVSLTQSRRWLFNLLREWSINPLYTQFWEKQQQFWVFVEEWADALRLAKELDAVLAPMSDSNPLRHASYFGGHNVSVVAVIQYDISTEHLHFRGDLPMYKYQENEI